MAATKIVDLAKKVRELTANYESEKTRNKQLAKICQDYEGKLKELKNQNQNQFNNYDGKHLDDYDDEMGEKKVDLAKENKELLTEPQIFIRKWIGEVKKLNDC